ncbi:hypothetical protein ACJQWK_04073 [Exserohilum turcicum]
MAYTTVLPPISSWSGTPTSSIDVSYPTVTESASSTITGTGTGTQPDGSIRLYFLGNPSNSYMEYRGRLKYDKERYTSSNHANDCTVSIHIREVYANLNICFY